MSAGLKFGIVIATSVFIIGIPSIIYEITKKSRKEKEAYKEYSKKYVADPAYLPISFERFAALQAIAPNKWFQYSWDKNIVVYCKDDEHWSNIFDSSTMQRFYFESSKDLKEFRNWVKEQGDKKNKKESYDRMSKMLECWKKDIEAEKKNGDEMVSTALDSMSKRVTDYLTK